MDHPTSAKEGEGVEALFRLSCSKNGGEGEETGQLLAVVC